MNGNAIPTEHDEQVTLFRWWQMTKWARHGIVMAAIPNGGLRNVITAKKLKAEGVIPGIPDIILCAPRRGKHALFIEMKRRKGGQVSDLQAAMRDALESSGYAVRICRGFDEARTTIEDYLGEA